MTKAGPPVGPPALVDVNVCVGPVPTGAHRPLDEAGVRAQMGRLGIDVSVVHHSWARWSDVRRGNDAVLALTSGCRDLVPACVVVPLGTGELGTDSEVSELVAATRLAVAHPARHGWRLAGLEARSLLERLDAAGRALLVPVDETTLDDVHEVAERHPDLALILTRVGYRNLRRLTAVMDAHPAVHCDLSYFAAHEALERVVESLDRCPFVYGSASPDCDAAGSVARLRWSGLDARWHAAVARDNAVRLLGLTPVDAGAGR